MIELIGEAALRSLAVARAARRSHPLRNAGRNGIWRGRLRVGAQVQIFKPDGTRCIGHLQGEIRAGPPRRQPDSVVGHGYQQLSPAGQALLRKAYERGGRNRFASSTVRVTGARG
jgi:hypothetical protein